MVQKSKSKDVDFPSLIIRRESKEDILNNNWSKVILKDINIYDDGKFSKNHYNSSRRTNKYVTITVSSPDEIYTDEFIVKPSDTGMVELSPEKLFKKLQSKKDKHIYVCNLPSPFGNLTLRLNKPIYSSGLKNISEVIIRKMIPKSLFITCTISLFLALLFIYNMSGSNYLIFLFILQMFNILISLTVYNFTSYKLNKNQFELQQPKGMDKIDESSNISHTIQIKENSINEFDTKIAKINTHTNGDVEVYTEDIKWIFDNENGEISKDAIKFYKDNVDRINNEDDINIFVTKYNQNILDDNEYISECNEWIMKSSIY